MPRKKKEEEDKEKEPRARKGASQDAKQDTNTVTDKKAEKKGVKRGPGGKYAKGTCGGPGRKHIPSRLLQMARESAEKIWPIVEEKALSGDKDAIEAILKYGMPKTRLCVDDPDIISPKCKLILKKIATGEISLKDAALEMEKNGIPLPETVRILLGKQEPEPEDAGEDFCVVTNEEIERRRAAAEVARDNEEWLADRREEMDELHKQVGDSYAPEAQPEEEK